MEGTHWLERAAVRNGDLLLIGGDGLFAKAIRQVTGGPYNHVELLAGGDTSTGAMEGQGVRSCNWRQEFKGQRFAIGEVQGATQAQASRALEWAQRKVGKGYDTRALLGTWLRFALKWVGIKIGGITTDEQDKWYCSELAAAAYQSEGQLMAEKPSLQSPNDQYASPEVRIIQEGIV